jgi:hypothetical protein
VVLGVSGVATEPKTGTPEAEIILIQGADPDVGMGDAVKVEEEPEGDAEKANGRLEALQGEWRSISATTTLVSASVDWTKSQIRGTFILRFNRVFSAKSASCRCGSSWPRDSILVGLP